MPIFFLIKMLLSSYLKQILLTIGAVVTAIFLSFYLLGWWGILSSIVLVPLILFFSIAYLVNEIKRNPMMMFQSMVMGTPGVGSVMGTLKENNVSMDDVSSMLMKSSQVFSKNKASQSFVKSDDVEDVKIKDIVEISENTNIKTKTAS